MARIKRRHSKADWELLHTVDVFLGSQIQSSVSVAIGRRLVHPVIETRPSVDIVRGMLNLAMINYFGLMA